MRGLSENKRNLWPFLKTARFVQMYSFHIDYRVLTIMNISHSFTDPFKFRTFHRKAQPTQDPAGSGISPLRRLGAPSTIS
ncbi:hypothetical protein AVEN_120697-1 [Araneus ventricosus]|uniref:Uncharacterized protein n=1 Tax=Araneus ventricosus TaxID=182803 RepID=A0A4Y2T7X3_ARAVE|nr:hypothetical protein AVEN_120697-1 [Araneus ventricosus]